MIGVHEARQSKSANQAREELIGHGSDRSKHIVVLLQVAFQMFIGSLPCGLSQTIQFASVSKDEILTVGKLGFFFGKRRQPDVVRVGGEGRLELFQTQQMRRACFDVIEPVLVPPVVAQNFLK